MSGEEGKGQQKLWEKKGKEGESLLGYCGGGSRW